MNVDLNQHKRRINRNEEVANKAQTYNKLKGEQDKP